MEHLANTADLGSASTLFAYVILSETLVYEIFGHLIQSNLNSSNTDSFTMANSIDQANKYLRALSCFIMKLYVVCTH